MVEINWNNFRAKFNDREQTNFELLSYLLFLREFNQEKTGIFRYFNQAGIETEPIQVNGEWIGFQAKFYDTKISENKRDIKNSIEKAKEKNPNLNKIYFYFNQEFGKKTTKKPQYETDLENFAKTKDVKIEWRVPSHFQAQLFLDENKTLAQYFFSLDKGTIEFIVELINHTSNILFPIHSEIEFNGVEIKIDRSKILENLKATLKTSAIIILSGEGGVGKTALIKDFYNSIEKSVPFFTFKAIEFNNIAHINDFFRKYGNGTSNDFFRKYGNGTSTDFIKEFENNQEKYVIIDSAEKLSDLENPEIFQEFLSILLKNSWRVLFTTRYGYLDDLKYEFVEIYRLDFQLFDIEKLKVSELEDLSNQYNFVLPNNKRFLELLMNSFYLNEYLQNYESIRENLNYSGFKSLLWNKQILKSSIQKNNIHLKREKCFLSIAERRANTGNFFVITDECDESALQALAEDEIIKRDAGIDGYFITHDIYEEWALDKIIERTFLNRENDTNFFGLLGSSLPIRRAFRNWLSEKLLNNQNEIRPLIENSFLNDDLEKFWKDEILVSVLLSDYSDTFFQMFESSLLEDNQKLLIRTIFLLRIACKENDEKLLASLGLSKKNLLTL
jgi:hypothetical protein